MDKVDQEVLEQIRETARKSAEIAAAIADAELASQVRDDMPPPVAKVVENIHYRTEQFTLTKDELTAALRQKYGDEPIFSTGEISGISLQSIFDKADDYMSSRIVFREDYGD